MTYKPTSVDKEELAREVEAYKTSGKASERLGELFLEMARGLACKSNFANYTYNEEFISNGVYFLLRYCRGYDAKKGQCFSYCTQILYNSFLQIIAREKKRHAAHTKLVEEKMEELKRHNHHDY
jgi:hypothetical protein